MTTRIISARNGHTVSEIRYGAVRRVRWHSRLARDADGVADCRHHAAGRQAVNE